MKINRQINECHCYNCRKYEECQTKGVFDDDPGFDFCVNYEDVSYPDDDNDEKRKSKGIHYTCHVYGTRVC